MPAYPDPNSIVDLLKSQGKASDRVSRAKLYGELGLAGGSAAYSGAGVNNASFNNALMAALRSGANPPPAPGGAPAGPTPPASPVPSPYSPTGAPVPTAGPTPPANTRSTYANYDKALADYQLALNKREPTPEQLEEKRRRIQEVTDAITAEYNGLFAIEERAGKGRSAETRALNLTAGLGGSSFGNNNADKTNKLNDKQMALLAQEKAAKLASAISGVEDRMSTQFRQEREDALAAAKGNAELEKQFIDDQRERANGTIKGIAGSGVAWDKFKNEEPEIYAQLLEEYGGDEYAMHAEYNSELPEESKVKYENKITRGANGNAVMFRYGFDPITNKVTSNEYDLGTPYETYSDQKPIELGKGNVLVVPDGKGGYKRVATGLGSDEGVTPKDPKGTINSGSLKVTPDQQSEIQRHLSDTTKDANGYSIRGADGYTDPYVYRQALTDWVESGGLEKDFLAKWPPANYINPAGNATLPATLRNNKNPLPKTKTKERAPLFG